MVLIAHVTVVCVFGTTDAIRASTNTNLFALVVLRCDSCIYGVGCTCGIVVCMFGTTDAIGYKKNVY